MATLSLPWSFSPNTLADATKVQADFDAVRTHVNTELVNRDASIAFTAVPSGPGSDPVSANQLTRKQYVDNAVAAAVLAGTVAYTCRAAAPTGWLFLDGSTVVNGQSLYPALWAVIPVAWQSGSNIVLPNGRGRFLIGLDPGTAAYDAIAETGGAATVALGTANMAAHTHSGVTGVENQAHNHNPGSGSQFSNFTAFGGAQNFAGGGNAFPASNTTGTENQQHNHNFTTDNGTGSGSAFSILPPFMAFNVMIRAY